MTVKTSIRISLTECLETGENNTKCLMSGMYCLIYVVWCKHQLLQVASAALFSRFNQIIVAIHQKFH